MADAADHVAYAAELRADDRPDDAAAHYERALSLDPAHAEAHAEYATLLAAEDPASAEHHYREALTLAPDDPATHSDYGVLLYEENRPRDAREHLERAVETWLARDRRADALLDLDVLIRIDHSLDHSTAATARWRYAMDLLAETSVDPEVDRGLRALGTVLTARDVHDRVQDAVALGVEHLGRGEFQQAIRLFAPAWDQHDRLREGSAARQDARCAGTALAGFHRVAGNTREEGALVAELGGFRDRLAPGPRAVYDRLVGAAGRSPDDLRMLATDFGDAGSDDEERGETRVDGAESGGDESGSDESGSDEAGGDKSEAVDSARLFAFADLLELMDES
ncbi:tetratricopeptide repeat protein [Salinirubrum litoreum]|uniref:Tetratricopeptide repeat protein n=1 Tax=Salinirubrum litoreum TaxID=1126234 RepID=A0ABD5RBT9_9EURY|nr:tetratricopeptide repeat protein [Salinirubrum litoreum]